MATSIIGTFPILSHKKSQTDEYGFDYLSYQYTVKTSELGSYNLKKDDQFYGFNSAGSIVSINTESTGSSYVVESVETKNTPGELTEITINTVGSKNSPQNNSPRLCLLSGGPLIFGLSGTAPTPQIQIQGYGASGAGQSVEVKFLAEGGAIGQQEIFTTHFSSLMPGTFRGISLPAPQRQPGQFNNVRNAEDGSIVGGTFGVYHGFICKTILTEKRGSLLLVTLVYSEAGYAFVYNSSNQATSLYDFPRIG